MAIQYFRGSYGKVEMAPMMACIMITILPVIILYLICQKDVYKRQRQYKNPPIPTKQEQIVVPNNSVLVLVKAG